MFSLIPCFATAGLSAACCAANTACSLCCSLASCFGCRYNSKLSRLLYLFIFIISAALAVILRYWGEDILSGVTAIASKEFSGFCSNDRCWGAQGAYRSSFGTVIFFAVMAFVSFLVPITHLGGWLVKLFLFAVLLGLSFLPHNDTMVEYAKVARGFSVVFILAQVFLIIDLSYNVHETLLKKMDKADEELTAAGRHTGLCSNVWKLTYIVLSLILSVGSLVGIGLLYHYFGNCPLHNFFISFTIIPGVIFTVLSMMSVFGRGLLTPSTLFAYSVYLCYGAMSNNPNLVCNPMASINAKNEVSIYLGLAFAVLSVSWMAFNSAGNFQKAAKGPKVDQVVGNPVHDWNAKSNETAPTGSASSYGADKNDLESVRRDSDDSDDRHPADDSDKDAAKAERPWVFNIVMVFGSMYIAMVTTNWADPSASLDTAPNGNPELSNASMWVRIASQWAIHLLYLWTLVAPLCFPDREFS